MKRSTRPKSAKKPATDRTVAVDLLLIDTLTDFFRAWLGDGMSDDEWMEAWNEGPEAAPFRDPSFGRSMRDALERIGAEGRRAANDNGAVVEALETLEEYFSLEPDDWNRSRFSTARFHQQMHRRLARILRKPARRAPGAVVISLPARKREAA